MTALAKGGECYRERGVLKINFPEVKAGQALICGIAIACKGDLDSVRSFSAHSFQLGCTRQGGDGKDSQRIIA